MENLKIFLLLSIIGLLSAIPLPENKDFCTGENGLYQYEKDKEYVYDYSTRTQLWINDVSDESKSVADLNAKVLIKQIEPCTFLLRLENSKLSGESLSTDNSVNEALNKYSAVFRLNSQGELDTSVKFESADSVWSRNIKRAIISAFQVKSEQHLRALDSADKNSAKSAVVYESDILGRCRTTYSLKSDGYESGKSMTLNKKKSLQRCTLSNNIKSSAIQFVPYKNLPEFSQGRLFIENYSCESNVKGNLLNKVECNEVSTFKVGSRGTRGVQAVVKQTLQFKEKSSKGSSTPNTSSFVENDIAFEYDNEDVSEYETSDFCPNHAKAYLADICTKLQQAGFDNEHSSNFKDLVRLFRKMSKSDLVNFFEEGQKKCELASQTVKQALFFANTEDAVDIILSGMDKDLFSNQLYITEYPTLTVLGRYPNPSANLVKKLKDYLAKKPADFAYLNKMYLLYSTLVHTHCQKNGCSESQLADFSSIFDNNLGSNCADSNKKGSVEASLKAIGNIGFFKNKNVLEKCASHKENSLEVRVNAINSLRRFSCAQLESLDGNYKLLQDKNEDAEVRINAFLSLMRCSEGQKFQNFAQTKLGQFLAEENDVQVLSYIVDYAKEHGVTVLLNPILSDPIIKEKFSLNFKEISWNNYKYKYDLLKDGAIEVDTSVIYTTKTFIPRSFRFNVTLHLHGMSVNFLDANLRLEGLDDILKGLLIDKLTSEKLAKKLMEKPEQLLEFLQILASKLQYATEKPFASLSFRIYGSDVFYSKLDDKEKFKKLGDFLRNPRDSLLYKQILRIRNAFLFETRVRQPLLNGFEFSNQMDTGISLFVSKASTNAKSDKELIFKIDNFYSAALSVSKRFELRLNNQNRLALKKKVSLNTRVKMNVDGVKKNGTDGSSVTYNLNLSPLESIPLFVLDGKFYKLSKGSEYKQITNFKTKQVSKSSCTSERFHNVFGVDLCASAERPEIGPLSDLFKSFTSEDHDHDNDGHDDHGHDHDEDENASRPLLILAGPYHYELTLKNPSLLKSIIFNGHLTKEKGEVNFDADLSTKSQEGNIERRYELVYSRKRTETYRTWNRVYNLEMKDPGTGEVRFKLAGEAIYKKKELVSVSFLLDNKIRKELLIDFKVSKKVDPDNVVPTYNLEAKLDSKVKNPRIYKLIFNVKPTGKDIKSEFYLDILSDTTNSQNVRIFDGKLDLTHHESVKYDMEYGVDFSLESFRKRAVKVNGEVAGSLFSSDVQLTIDIVNPSVDQRNMGTIFKFSHLIDASSKSHIEMAIVEKEFKEGAGFKLIFEFKEDGENQQKSVELNLVTPFGGSKDQPIVLYFRKSVKADDKSRNGEYNIGLTNAMIYLDSSRGPLSQALVKVDGDNFLRSLTFRVKRVHDKVAHKIDHLFELKKNEKDIARIEENVYGNLAALRAIDQNNGELSKQSLGASLNVKVMESTGSFKVSCELESSPKNAFNSYSFDLQAENFFKTLLKISSLTSKAVIKGDKIDSQFNIVKLGDVKSMKITSVGNLRPSGDFKEFNVNYEKTLANGNVLKSTGIAKYKWKNFKNFESSLNVDKHFRSKFFAENKRDAKSVGFFGHHNFEFNYAHLDHQPVERDIKLSIHNNTNEKPHKFIAKLDAKKGAPNTLSDKSKLDYSVNWKLETHRTPLADGTRKLVKVDLSEEIKIKKYNTQLEFDLDYDLDLKTKDLKADVELEAKFPAFITNPGTLNHVNKKLVYKKNLETKSGSISYKSDTNSRIFGKVFRVFNLEAERKSNGDKFKEVNFDIHYKRPKAVESDDDDDEEDDIKKDLKNAKLNVKYDQDYKYKSMNLKLDGSYSDMFTLFELNHEKFNKNNGLIEYKYIDSLKMTKYYKLGYKRELDTKTNKLVKGNYEFKTQHGADASKSCELKIEAKSDYINSMACKIKTPSTPIELSYGYLLKIDNPQDFMYGKRGGQLDINLPTRTLRATYKANHATPIDGTDDDQDDNDHREYNGTANLYWDYLKDSNKYLTVNLKRDNYGKGKTRFFLHVLNHPSFNIMKLEADRVRKFNETNIKALVGYELKSGVKNSLTFDATLSSDLDSRSISFETNLDRPSYNTLYENKFDKRNGRLQSLNIRVGKLIKLSVDKEFDPENRLISLELVSPDASKYKVEKTTSLKNKVYVVESQLKENNNVLSKMVSTFDSNNNQFEVKINAVQTKANYKLNFGVFSESIATAVITDENKNEVLGQASVGVVADKNNKDVDNLVLTFKWNRLWGRIRSDILGGKGQQTSTNENFNSYLGDVYGGLTSELKTAYEKGRKERLAIRDAFRQLFFLQAEYYATAFKIPFRPDVQQVQDETPDEPLHKRLFKKYNNLANCLNSLHLAVRSKCKMLSKYVPRLSVIKYNAEPSSFANNLEVSRPTFYASNLYQFNAEYRHHTKKIGDRIQRFKGSLVRNLDGMGIRALINKYKYRKLNDYTLVGHVYNKRNIIGFDGEAKSLQTKCGYLLAHDMSKNKFSLVLNYNDQASSVLTLHAYGKGPIDISYDKVSVNKKQVALPHRVDLGEDNGQIVAKKINNGVCVELNHDLSVCCYQDTNSCTVAMTRWYTGKVNGLLGKADNDLESIDERQWFLSKSCNVLNAVLKRSSEEAVRTCYSIFGKHRKATFRNAFGAVRPEPWQKICETVLTNDMKAKCTLMRAFVRHAKFESVEVNEPYECTSCSVNNKEFPVDRPIYKSELTNQNDLFKGTDFVFLVLPCDKSKYSFDFSTVLMKKQKNDKYYIVKVDEKYASIYQSETGEDSNFDLKKAYQALSVDKTVEHIPKQSFYEGLVLAGTLFSRRLAQHRNLIIQSCGNCLPYSGLDTLKLFKKFQQRNVVISSVGDYEIENLEGDGNKDEIPIGYGGLGGESIFLYNPSTKKVETDLLDSYKIDHKADICQRLAVKTKGNVFNVKYTKDNKVIEQISSSLEDSIKDAKFEYSINSCKHIDTPYGDFNDFSYTKTYVPQN